MVFRDKSFTRLDSKNNLTKAVTLYMQHIYLPFIHNHILWSISFYITNGDILCGWQIQIGNVAATKEVASVVTWSTYHDGTNASVFIKQRTLPKQYKKYDYISQYLFACYHTSFELVYHRCEIIKIKITVFWDVKPFSLVVTYHSLSWQWLIWNISTYLPGHTAS